MRSSTTRVSSRWSELRDRGVVWVVAQFALMGVMAVAWLVPPEWPDPVRTPFRVVGVALALAGVGLALWAHRSLGSSFTAFTTPPSGGARVESGPYRYVRHPMYGGGILAFAGFSLALSVPSLPLVAALAALWRAKSGVEERALAARYPDYAEYRRHTPHRFLPGLF
jgi:protein-S-isoprenylcysteine O-methyltransferase Ste14